jgi:glycosyltransferase involved in cell wall biosynthesis/tetratricopeptide (TPR) repeat protein
VRRASPLSHFLFRSGAARQKKNEKAAMLAALQMLIVSVGSFSEGMVMAKMSRRGLFGGLLAALAGLALPKRPVQAAPPPPVPLPAAPVAFVQQPAFLSGTLSYSSFIGGLPMKTPEPPLPQPCGVRRISERSSVSHGWHSRGTNQSTARLPNAAFQQVPGSLRNTMTLRYLVGPVTPARAREWASHRQQDRCLTFNAQGTTDVVLGPNDSWADFLSRLPDGWRPDFVVVDLGYTTVPRCLWDSPVPLVALTPDPQLQWHFLRRFLPLCSVVLTDTAGVAALHKQGITQAEHLNLFGLQDLFTQPASSTASRDIDLLFVGNMNPAVQGERLRWLGRLSRLAGRWRVSITQGVHGEEYRQLLLRSRIVFNRSVRSEWNLRVGETCSCGALLFSEADNQEMAREWRHGEDCIFYDEDNLEALLERYLSDESERSRIAENGRLKALKFPFTAAWEQALARLEERWNEIRERHEQRPKLEGKAALLARTWQALGAADAGDATLMADLDAALVQESNPSLLVAGGMMAALRGQARQGYTPEGLRQIGRWFHQATQAGSTLGALNLVETLVALAENAVAVEGARRLLAQLLGGLAEEDLELPRFPPGYDHFRVEWERAAWQHAGSPAREAEAKLALIRWRLHMVLGDLTGELHHFHEAVLARPDLPIARAALGCALGRAKRPVEAVGHLDVAVKGNPFDTVAARALCQALLESGRSDQAETLKQEHLLLHLAAPTLIPAKDWFSQPQRGDDKVGDSLVVSWEGAFLNQHSLGLVNRALSKGLIERKHELSLIPLASPGVQIDPGEQRDFFSTRFRKALTRPEDVCVRLGWPPRWQAPAQGHWVVFQPWEYSSIPRDWLRPLVEQVDDAWVPSTFVRDGFVQSGVPAERVFVLPLGFDEGIFRPGQEPLRLDTTKRFMFLFVGGTIHRKGIDILLKAYGRAFTNSDDVCLVIKDMGVGSFYKGQTAETLIADFRAENTHPEIVYLNESLSEQEMARLYNGCDCLVQPYRGEGFGLPILEAMACGLPVLVTGYGAALDFCNSRTATLIPAKPVLFPEKRVGDIETVGHPHLAKPDEEALAELMREAVERPDGGKRRAEKALQRVLAGFTWKHVAALAEQRLLDLREKPVRRQAARPSNGRVVQTHGEHPRTVPAQGLPREAVSNRLFTPQEADEPVYAPVPVSSNGARQRLSVCIIAKDEEHNLPACLDCLAGLDAEIVVCDTGSTDRTREIAREKGAKVVEFPWIDHFAAARNACLEHASGEWIFWLDADDRLDVENREKLRLLLANLPNENVGYSMKCRCLADPAHGTETTVDHIRLFRNDPRIRWRYRVHEQILPAIREAGGEVRWADVEIQHTGYTDPALRQRKLQRDMRLLRMEYEEQPHDPFTLFNLGQSLQEMGQPAEALPFLAESLERSHPKDSIVRKLYSLMANCHLKLEQPREALALCVRGEAVCPDDAELLLLEGIIRTVQQDYHGAKAALVRLLGTESGQHFASVSEGLRGYQGRHQLALVCFRLQELNEAEVLWEAVLRERPGFLPARVGLGDVYLAQRRWQDLEGMAASLAALPGGEVEAILLRGRGHLERQEFTLARKMLEEARERLPGRVPVLDQLSYAVLREDREHAYAETLLHEILAFDPNHVHARQNLQVLHGRLAARQDRVFLEDGAG